MPVVGGAGAASGRAMGWVWRPMTRRDAVAHRPALVADLDRWSGRRVEDALDVAADEGGVDLEGVAVQADGRRLGDGALLGPQERLVQLRRCRDRRTGRRRRTARAASPSVSEWTRR